MNLNHQVENVFGEGKLKPGVMKGPVWARPHCGMRSVLTRPRLRGYRRRTGGFPSSDRRTVNHGA
eukprot:762750-Hanusia_phi.AAC.1